MANILTKAISILLVPIYVRFLTPGDYGYLELLLATSSFLLILMQMGMGSAIFRAVIYKPNVDKNLNYSVAFYFLIVTSTIFLGILYFMSQHIALLLFDSDQANTLLRLVFLTVFFNVFSTIPLAYLRINNKSIRFSMIAVIGFLLELLLNILFVIFLKKGVAGIILAGLIKAAMFVIIYVLVMRESLELNFSIKELKDMLGFGLPMVPAALSLTILTISNRYFLKSYCTFEDVGIFTLGHRIGMVMALIVNSFQIAWPSILFSIARERNATQTYAKIFTYYLLIIIFIGLAISIFAAEIIRIIATTIYLSAARIIPFIVVSYIFVGIYYLTSVGINLKKKTQYEPFIVGAAALVNLLLNYLLIPRFGISGAAIASAISFIIMGLIEWKISSHFYFIVYEYTRLAKLILVALSIYFISSLLKTDYLILSLCVKLLLLFSFPFLLYCLKFYESVEMVALKQFFKKQILKVEN